MILVDYIGHLVSTESAKELLAFADRLGMRRSWFQNGPRPHYDLTTNRMINKALRFGAKKVRPKELVKRAWWNK